MNLKTIATNALNEISGIAVPDSFAGNPDPNAKLAIALANRSGRSLARKFNWQALIFTHEFPTEAGIDNYALPDGFQTFANMSHWDRSNFRHIEGPASAAEWQWLKVRMVTPSELNRWFRIQGKRFYLNPVPSVGGVDISFDYYSQNWVQPTEGANKDGFTADTDKPLFDSELVTLDLKWRFLQAKGFPSEVEYREWDDMLSTILADEGGARTINMNGIVTNLGDNLPDTGYGL